MNILHPTGHPIGLFGERCPVSYFARTVSCFSPQEDEVKRIESELSRLQMEREQFNEEKTCAVCLDRQKAIVFDCGHTTCAECSLKMRLCHSCRKPIAKKIKFY